MTQYNLTLRTIVKSEQKIFDFDYPIFDETYRETFEKRFIRHFYYDEISMFPFGKWLYRLETKLNEIMPYWNQVYEAYKLELRILDNYEIVETYDKNYADNSQGNVDSTGESKNINNSKDVTNVENLNLQSDTPKKKINIDTYDVVSGINKDKNKVDSSNDSTTNNTNKNKIINTTDNTGTEKWKREMKGNIGVATDMDAITNYTQGLRNIDLEVFDELSTLFMGVF